MHYNHMFFGTDCYLLARIVRPHLGGDAMLYSVSICMSVGSLLSGNMKTMDCGEGPMCIDHYRTQQICSEGPMCECSLINI